MSAPGLIFDLDETLYPERQFIRSGFHAVAAYVDERHGVPAAAALATLFDALRHGNRAAALQALCVAHHLPASHVAELVDVIRTHAPSLRLPQESRDALVTARTRGWRIGVLTNGMPAVQMRKTAALGLSAFVDEIVYAQDWGSGRGKPEPEPFEVVMERLRVHAGTSVFVGDDPWCDIFGARRARLRTLLVCRTAAQLNRARACEADAVVTRIDEVPDAAVRLVYREVSHAA
jgi:putative hydrolase of the HAD superfamily